MSNSTDQAMHAQFAALAKQVFAEAGVAVTDVRIQWIATDALDGKRDKVPLSIQIESHAMVAK